MADSVSISSTVSNTSVLSFDFNAQDIHCSCPEKIVLCIDLANDVQTTTVKSRERGEVALLTVWKNALELFVFNKSAMNSNHEFALVVLTDKANWFCNFMSSPQLVTEAIQSLEPVTDKYQSFDTESLFSTIHENCPPPSATVAPPPFVVRVIMLYGRSHCMPIFQGDVEAHGELMGSPYFFMDIIYSHEPPSTFNSCQSIFDILSEVYPKPKALVLDWSVSLVKLLNYFAKLLAHPLQRPLQANMDNKLMPST